MRNERRLSCGRVWMAAAGQRHFGVHLWTNADDGTTTRHAGSDENQEEEFTYGKCLVVTRLAARLLVGGIGQAPRSGNNSYLQ